MEWALISTPISMMKYKNRVLNSSSQGLTPISPYICIHPLFLFHEEVPHLLVEPKLSTWVPKPNSPYLLRDLVYQFLSLLSFSSPSSLHIQPLSPPPLKTFSWLLYSQKEVLSILLPCLATTLFPLITKPLKRVVDMLSAPSHLSLLNPCLVSVTTTLLKICL